MQACWRAFRPRRPRDLSVVFKAMLSALNGTPVTSFAPTDVAAFFASYKAEIVHLASIAQAGGVEIFCIGNEMSSLSGAQYRAYWTDLISAVRNVYDGELTYAAATDEASKVGFWDQLDIIGVNTYPPLTSSTTPTVQELVQAWSEVPFNPYYADAFDNKSPVDFLHGLSVKYGLPVLMTEVGYRSLDGTAIRPGGWTAGGTADVGEQADAYNAFFQVWSAHGGSWLKGVEFWQWDLNNKYSPTGYSVMGKPAEAIVSEYFHGGGLAPGLTIPGSPGNDLVDIGRGNDVINGGLGDDVIRAGAGDDLITAGPAAATRLATTTITVTGYGSMVGGVGAQARILVNGQQVSGVYEFKPAADPSAYQTMTVTFDNPGCHQQPRYRADQLDTRARACISRRFRSTASRSRPPTAPMQACPARSTFTSAAFISMRPRIPTGSSAPRRTTTASMAVRATTSSRAASATTRSTAGTAAIPPYSPAG